MHLKKKEEINTILIERFLYGTIFSFSRDQYKRYFNFFLFDKNY